MPLKTGRLSVNAVKLSSFSFLCLLLLPFSSSSSSSFFFFSLFFFSFFANDRGCGRSPYGAAPDIKTTRAPFSFLPFFNNLNDYLWHICEGYCHFMKRRIMLFYFLIFFSFLLFYLLFCQNISSAWENDNTILNISHNIAVLQEA